MGIRSIILLLMENVKVVFNVLYDENLINENIEIIIIIEFSITLCSSS